MCLKVKNIRISRWRGYMNQHDSEELRDVHRWGGDRAARQMAHYIPPRKAYDKWIYSNESERLKKSHREAVRFLVVVYEPKAGRNWKRELHYRQVVVRTVTSLEAVFGMSYPVDCAYTIFLDGTKHHLAEDALAELADVLEEQPLDMLYSDQDVWEAGGERSHPFFKPDWSPDTFRSFFYTGNLAAYRTELCRGISISCGDDFARCHYLFTAAFVQRAQKIGHIPEVLCHEEGDYQYIEGSCLSDRTETGNDGKAAGKVSIIIPSKDHAAILRRCLDSLVQYGGSSFSQWTEIIVVDNGSREEEKKQLEQMAESYGFRYIYDPKPFNFSAMCNTGARVAGGDYLLFLNDDIEAMEEGWLEKMRALAAQSHAGAVGAKLYYPGGRKLQHMGVINLDIGPGHCFLEKEDTGDFYYGRNRYDYNYLAVTAACLLVRKPVYEQMGGFDENLVVGYNDVDFCFSLYENGYYNVLCNGARLYHHESLSRGYDKGNIGKEKRLLEEKKYLYEKHPHLEKRDPFYSPNLTRYLGEFEWNLDAYGCQEELLPELPCSKVEPFRWDIRQEWLDPNLVFQVDRAVWKDGRGRIEGWAYIRDRDNFNYIRRILLRAPDGACVWVGTRSRYRGYLKEQFPEVEGMDLLAYTCDFACADLPECAEYQIGMAAESLDGKELHIIFSEWKLERKES